VERAVVTLCLAVNRAVFMEKLNAGTERERVREE
jgi:hypothetical protein